MADARRSEALQQLHLHLQPLVLCLHGLRLDLPGLRVARASPRCACEPKRASGGSAGLARDGAGEDGEQNHHLG